MKQTAVEWLANRIIDLEERLRLKEINLNDFIEEKDLLVEQAKAMEKEQHQETFKQSRQAKIFEQDMPPVWKSFEQYYNETFKSE